MTSPLGDTILATHPCKQDVKVSEYDEHAKHIEQAEHAESEHAENVQHNKHIEDVQVHDIHLEAGPDLQKIEAIQDEPPASLLTLPVEIRLRIYEMAYNATFLHSKLQWEGGLKLQLHGTSFTEDCSIRLTGSPFTLLRVCRRLYYEVSPMLPPISDLALQFEDFSGADMRCWLELLSDSQMVQLRSFKMTGWGTCQLKNPLYVDDHRVDCHRYRMFPTNCPVACTGCCSDLDGDIQGLVARAKNRFCDRSLTLNLNVFERQFHAERFERIVNQRVLNSDSPGSHREFHKACYLLRLLDGCVYQATPKAHPAGRNSQCGRYDVVEAAVASFVSDEGKVVVTREKVVGLLRATIEYRACSG